VHEGTETTGAFRFRYDMNERFGLPPNNVFLVKFS
jgi:hypothetical protein